jgi:UDP-N-acetylglucosamine transferase subunit ALG13
MSELPRRRRALLVADDDSVCAAIAEALASYAFDVESEASSRRPDVVIVLGTAAAGPRLDLVVRIDAPLVVVLRDEQVDEAAAKLLRREHIALRFPVDPIEVVRAARRLTREIVTIW